VAGRVALAHAAILENVDLLASGSAEVAAGEAADGPAHRRIGAAEMQEVLLRLVAGDQHHALLGEGALASRLDPEEALQGVDAGAREAPVLVAGPFELGPHRLGHAPTVGEAELGKDRAGSREAEVLDQVLAQKPHRHASSSSARCPAKRITPPSGSNSSNSL
jgi:hypothetical protein